MPGFKDHFSSHAAGYAARRPTYPVALVDFLAELAPARGLALDCGCGSGQLSVLLAERFERVVATDASAQQIANAEPHQRVEYRASPAESSGLPPASADLVTVAQAAHWFDLGPFYAEVRRVARAGAPIALIAYETAEIDHDIDPVVQDFYRGALDPYWPPERRHIEAGYRTLDFPFDEIEAPLFTMEQHWSLDQLVGYFDTWSAVRAMEKAEGRAPFEAFRRTLAAAWGDPATVRAVTWPLSMRLGRV